jgi:hypothetical protein
VPSLYDPDDRDRGYVEVANRRGELQRFRCCPSRSAWRAPSSGPTRTSPSRRDRHRDEGLHEGDRRVVVGDRPPNGPDPYSGAGSAR